MDATIPNLISPSSGFASKPSWEQDFTKLPNGPIDTKVWRYELDPAVPAYNNEAQAYTDHEKNVRIEGGMLVLEAHREEYQYPSDPSGKRFNFTSGRIDTRDTFSFEYGKFEATMKLPRGDGTWPAVWFLSATQPFTDKLHPTDADWAKPRFYMHDGELDAMEAYGKDPGVIEGTLHTFEKDQTIRTTIPTDDAFHTYGVEVSPDKVVWTVDGKAFGTFTKPSGNTDEWPFGQSNRFYPILNLAMGGAGGDTDSTTNTWSMEVRDIRFFDYRQP